MRWKFVTHLKDYCVNCTLSGFSYMANENLHFTERLFWLICVVLSAWGCYHLIDEYENDFESRAVSIVYESIHPFARVKFPTISVCDLYNKYELGPDIEEYVASMEPCGLDCYNYEIETHIAFIMYPYFYHDGVIRGRCEQYENCGENCAKCPANNYRGLLEKFGANCSSLFNECSLSYKSFDCCKYFLPLITPFGKCFLLNSLQNNKKDSPTWFKSMINPAYQKPIMTINSKRPIQVSILNEEDVPHYALPTVKVEIMQPGQRKSFQFFIENMINDPGVRDISPHYRQCRFADELVDDTGFKAYSFSSCMADCVRQHQMALCNCSAYSLMPTPLAKYPDCDLNGYMCLERNYMVKRDAKPLLPWSDSNHTCTCLPSCTENDIRSVYESNSETEPGAKDLRIDIMMSNLPSERYRRQALRSRLDAVVSIGGILGLFLGASLLSGLEFLYYFTIRLWNDVRRARRQQ
uniref:Uncharacterized protein n=1 Tax=Glossina palpalis gambiensis TaxID=67801 RepID=A0A1B0BEX6_9MUSC